MRHVTETQTKWRQSSGRQEVLNVIVASRSLLRPFHVLRRWIFSSDDFGLITFAHRQRFLRTWRNAAIHQTRFSISTTFINNNSKHSLSLHPSGDIEQTVFTHLAKFRAVKFLQLQMSSWLTSGRSTVSPFSVVGKCECKLMNIHPIIHVCFLLFFLPRFSSCCSSCCDSRRFPCAANSPSRFVVFLASHHHSKCSNGTTLIYFCTGSR